MRKRELIQTNPVSPVRHTVSECIALAKSHELEVGEIPILDADFADDMRDIMEHHQTWNPPKWD